MDPAGIELTTSRLRQFRQLPVVQHVRFTPLKLRQKRNSNDMPEAALDNLQPVRNAQVSISTPVCVNFELRSGVGDKHICWFDFDALAQENAYKPTKEPINYRGPGGDRTHDLQTEATPPAASCPARTLHATEIASKTQLQWHARGCTDHCPHRWLSPAISLNDLPAVIIWRASVCFRQRVLFSLSSCDIGSWP